MPQLVISVRNVAEALLACQAGADLIDIKEPSRGSLGAPAAATIREIVRAVCGQVPISVALGELLDQNTGQEYDLDSGVLHGVRYVKLGLAGCAARSDWFGQWQVTIDRLPDDVEPVAVVYADANSRAPSVDAILAAAVSVAAPIVLVDTFEKWAGNLLAHWSLARTGDFVTNAHELGLQVALAGSLDLAAIGQLLPIGPDFIAVRGAVCSGSRQEGIDPNRLLRLVEVFRSLHVDGQTHSSAMTATHPSAMIDA
ncbi:MAG: (5-formylfuran-3-yl)methyl phosphate synthase [Planctomycetia bacterium]|nr:(5-formylfuran-3-yl)methyl phosphate synthase [Planctomycetia bacterium]